MDRRPPAMWLLDLKMTKSCPNFKRAKRTQPYLPVTDLRNFGSTNDDTMSLMLGISII